MRSTTAPALPDTPAGLLRAVRDQRDVAARADVEMMRPAVQSGAEHLARLGSTDTIHGRRATALARRQPAIGFEDPEETGSSVDGQRAQRASTPTHRWPRWCSTPSSPE